MDVHLRNVRFFVTLAEELHFGRAAARLYTSQPNLSQQIRRLEEELGVQLLLRTSRTVRLTEAGEILLERGRRLLAEGEETLLEVRRAAAGELSTVKLGTTPVPRWAVLPRLAHEFRTRHPGMRLLTREGKPHQLIPALLDLDLDAALILCPPLLDELAYEAVSFEPAVVALPASHALAAEERISLVDLRHEQILSFSRTLAPGYLAAVVAICRAAGFDPAISARELAFDESLELVRAGFGVAIVPASSPDAKPDGDGIAVRPLVPPAALPVALCWLRDRSSASVPHLVATARDLAAREGWLGGPPPPEPVSVDRTEARANSHAAASGLAGPPSEIAELTED